MEDVDNFYVYDAEREVDVPMEQYLEELVEESGEEVKDGALSSWQWG